MITSVITGFYVYRGCLTKEAKKFNIDLVNIWEVRWKWEMTSQLQVLDIITNKPFKNHFKMKYN